MCLVAAHDVYGQAKAQLEDEELLMGNIVKLSIDVPVPADTSIVMFPAMEEARRSNLSRLTFLNDTIEILTEYNVSIEHDNSKIFRRFDLQVQAFDSGRYEIPGLDFIVGNQTIKSNPVYLSVIPVKAAKEDKIDPFTDVAGPFEINPALNEEENTSDASFLWWLIPLGVALLTLIVFLIIKYRKTGSIFTFKPVPPSIQALNRLNKLEKQNLPERGKVKEYYTKLTDVLRDYLKKEFGIKTFEKTSAEILQQVDNNERTAHYSSILNSLLETSDFVKFARVNPSGIENSRCMQEAKRFVEITGTTNADTVSNKEGGKA